MGKGRDVGLNQISLFEAKIANGNGEQVLSRDIYRLGHRFDFFRMLSCYFTTVGYYFSTMVIRLSITLQCFLKTCIYLLVFPRSLVETSCCKLLVYLVQFTVYVGMDQPFPTTPFIGMLCFDSIVSLDRLE